MEKKKNSKKLKKENNKNLIKHDYKNSYLEGVNPLKVVIIVLSLFIVFYIVTVSITGGFNFGRDNSDDDNEDYTSIQYDEIIAGETFNQKSDNYYVLFYDFDEYNASLYAGIVNSYKEQEEARDIFIVDLHKGFSKPYIGDTSNPEVNRIEDLKVNGPTLILIENGQQTLYAEGVVAIKEALTD